MAPIIMLSKIRQVYFVKSKLLRKQSKLMLRYSQVENSGPRLMSKCIGVLKVCRGSIESTSGFIWQWTQMHFQLNPYTLSSKPLRIYIWTPEAVWNELGTLYSESKRKKKFENYILWYIMYKANHLNPILATYLE